jgi:hypothetical protein
MKKIQLALSAIAAIGLSAFALSASATTVLFSEDFEGYTSFPDLIPLFPPDPVNAGIPKISEGAAEVWYGARFEKPDDGTIDSDLAVQKFGGGSNNTHTGRTEDDAGLLFKLDTTNRDAITLSFDWRTFLADTNDRFVVGYHIGPISQFGTCTGEGETGCFANLRTALPWYTNQNDLNPTLTGNWSQLLRDTESDDWMSESFLLPDAVENQSEVWFAFWLDNGEGDFAKVDNINVTATVIPVPPAVWLFGSGLLGLVAVSRRRDGK